MLGCYDASKCSNQEKTRAMLRDSGLSNRLWAGWQTTPCALCVKIFVGTLTRTR